MFVGFFGLETQAFALVTVENATGVAVAADDDLVTFRIYGSSETPVATGTATVFDVANLTGVYLCSFTITGGFARGGNYQGIASFEVSNQPREKSFSLSIM